jgi:hypothetical protein
MKQHSAHHKPNHAPVRNISALIEVPVFVITLMLSNATDPEHPTHAVGYCHQT